MKRAADSGSASDESSKVGAGWEEDYAVNSATLRARTLVRTGPPSVKVATDKCVDASEREGEKRERDQRRSGRVEELFRILDASARRGVPEDGWSLKLPKGLSAPWLQAEPDALALVDAGPGQGKGYAAAKALAPGTTLLVCRPIVAHFEGFPGDDEEDEDEKDEDDDDDDDDDAGSSDGSPDEDEDGAENNESGNDYANGSGEDDSENDDFEDDFKGDDNDPFLVDDSVAALVIQLVEELLDPDNAKPAPSPSPPSPSSSSPDVHTMVASLFPRAADELPSGAPPEGSHAAWRCRDPELDAVLAAALDALAEGYQGPGGGGGKAGGGGGGGGGDRAAKKPKKAAAAAAAGSGLGTGSGSALGAALALRLPEIVRCNALGLSTGSELLCFPDPSRGHAALTGLGLYHAPSFFNHSCSPNVSRFHLGDLAVFRTNRPVAPGQALCISYLGHDLLPTPLPARRAALAQQHKHFELPPRDAAEAKVEAARAAVREGRAAARAAEAAEAAAKAAAKKGVPAPADDGGGSSDSDGSDDEEEDWSPRVGPELLEALLEMPPRARLAELAVISNDTALGAKLLACDRKELALQEAVAWSHLGRPGRAAKAWEAVLRLASALPGSAPNDEATAVYAVQAAVCKLAEALRLSKALAAFEASGAAAGKGKGKGRGGDDGEEDDDEDNEADPESLRDEAALLLAHACAVHDVAFGGGAFVMALRYKAELLERPPFFPEACAVAWGIVAAGTEEFRAYD